MKYKQKEIINELQEQFKILSKESMKNGQCVSNLLDFGKDLANLALAISLIEKYIWRMP